jgi:hypothetical protein
MIGRERDGARLPEFGTLLEHVVQLRKDALSPAIILVEQATGGRACEIRAAEQGQTFVGELDAGLQDHGQL